MATARRQQGRLLGKRRTQYAQYVQSADGPFAATDRIDATLKAEPHKVFDDYAAEVGRLVGYTEDRDTLGVEKLFHEILGRHALVRCLYLIRWGWSASAPRRAFLSASYSE